MLNETIHECRCCCDCSRGLNDGSFFKLGWGRIENIDGRNAICPACQKDPLSLDALREDGYENAYVVPGKFVPEKV
jgi:hypothetical protein